MVYHVVVTYVEYITMQFVINYLLVKIKKVSCVTAWKHNKVILFITYYNAIFIRTLDLHDHLDNT